MIGYRMLRGRQIWCVSNCHCCEEEVETIEHKFRTYIVKATVHTQGYNTYVCTGRRGDQPSHFKRRCNELRFKSVDIQRCV